MTSEPLFQPFRLLAQFVTLLLQGIDPTRQAITGAFPRLPCPLLAHIPADSLKVFHAGAIAPITLIDDGADGVQAKAGFFGDSRAAIGRPYAA